MTIQEIRDLIAKKISGQGTMVDVGGGLPAILNGILDLVAASPSLDTIVGDIDAAIPNWNGAAIQTDPTIAALATKPILKWRNEYYVLASYVPAEIMDANQDARTGKYWCICDYESDSHDLSGAQAIFYGFNDRQDQILVGIEY